MSDLHKHMLKLSDGQKKKLIMAFKKRNPAVIGLASDQMKGGKDGILLTDEQNKMVKKALKNAKGLRLNISYDQLVKSKEGGLLKEILNFGEYIPIVNNLVPYVRKGASFVNSKMSKIRSALDWLEKELKDVSGSGIHIKKLRSLLPNN